ncbi:MAG: response regulator transcription factor [Pseudomonadales bacterium]
MTQIHCEAKNLYSFQDECLKLLMGALNIRKAAAYLVDNQGNSLCFKRHQLNALMHRQYLDQYQQHDPLHPNNLSDNKVCVASLNDVVSLGERTSHPYYTEFIKPWKIQNTVELYLHANDSIIAGFSMFIDDSETDLLTADMSRLKYLHDFMQFSLELCLNSPQQKNFDALCAGYQLTARERMVVEQVLQGFTNKNISNNLHCTVATIKTHLQHVFGKLGVNSKAEVASLMYQRKAWR